MNGINLALKVNQEIALDQNQSAKDRLEAALLVVEQQIQLLRLLRDGPSFVQPS